MQKLFFLPVIFGFFSFGHIKQQQNRSRSFVEPTFGHSAADSSMNPFESTVKELYQEVGLSAYNLPYHVFRTAMIGYTSLHAQKIANRNIITIIDYSKPSSEKRFYTIDLDRKEVLFHSLVAHGRNTGENVATSFSNKHHSNQSSLGFYLTGETYVGSKGYSLRLDGLENSYNSNLRSRAVVIHAADYVSESWIKKYGRLGRSQGCPALPAELNKKVIDTIKGKTVVFAYFADESYLTSSAFLNESGRPNTTSRRQRRLVTQLPLP